MRTNDSLPPTAEETAAAPPRSSDSRRAALISTLEGEVVPRLLMLCRTANAQQASAGSRKTTDRWDVEELARLLVAHGPETAWAFVEAVRQRGVPHERICLDLLVPVAHRLAEQWERRDFGHPELTLGLEGLLMVVVEIGKAAKKTGQFSRHS